MANQAILWHSEPMVMEIIKVFEMDETLGPKILIFDLDRSDRSKDIQLEKILSKSCSNNQSFKG